MRVAAVFEMSYGFFSPREECLEICCAWWGPDPQLTAVNTLSKLPLPMHAFEDLRLGHVCWRTDHLELTACASPQ
ncbi:hypothetical protein ACF07Y_46285 [Streptomyces sp. NPDC016566]|uniref:hypothetical protein n=1 Tax=Streptomyces sp. NPDC016566 TaxID=3364967 RepID=UPI0037014DC3